MPFFTKEDTKAFKKDVSEQIPFNISANITVVGSLKDQLLSTFLDIDAKDTFSYRTEGTRKVDIHLSLNCTVDYQQSRYGFFKPQTNEYHSEKSKVSVNRHLSEVRVSRYQKQLFDNPNLNILIVMPKNMEEYNQFLEAYKGNAQYTHLLVVQPYAPELYFDPPKFEQFKNAPWLYQYPIGVENDKLPAHTVKSMKECLSKLFTTTITLYTDGIEKAKKEEIAKQFKEECEAECLSQVRVEAEEFFNSRKCC